MIMSKMWHKNRPQRKKHSIAAAMMMLFMACVIALPLGAAETPLKNASLMPMWSPQA
jgi:NitT/TauT family transport system substrate-binding protein